MLKNQLVLPDGRRISSGVGTNLAIQSLTLTESVNSGEELVLGSACAAVMEATLFTPYGSLLLTAGDEVTLYKVSDAGTRTKQGVFILEKPTRPSANTMKLIGYDRMVRLDQDLTAWLSGLTGWPYTLLEFARMVCTACGLKLVTTAIPNGSFPVPKFQCANVTGRQLMQWIGEAACCFCRANADGNVELGWYEDTGLTIRPTGTLRYFAKGLRYETYQVAPVERVQLKLADGEAGALWPAAEGEANSYIISGNPILLTSVSAQTQACLQVIEARLKGFTYTPCQISMPAELRISVGSLIDVVDSNGMTVTACVMTKTGIGQRDTLECTGSPRRDSATAINNKTMQQIAQERVDAQTRTELFNKLTDNGAIQGLYVRDGRWYINAEMAQIINLVAEKLSSVSDESEISITGAILKMLSDGKETVHLNNEYEGMPILYMYDRENGAVQHTGEFSPHHIRLGGKQTGGILTLGVDDNSPYLILGQTGEMRTISWKDNGDGTYTLIGE